MSERQEEYAREVLDALRLAVIGAADDKSAMAVIRTLIADGPAAKRGDTNSVRRLLRAIKRTRRARFKVAGDQRSGDGT